MKTEGCNSMLGVRAAAEGRELKRKKKSTTQIHSNLNLQLDHV